MFGWCGRFEGVRGGWRWRGEAMARRGRAAPAAGTTAPGARPRRPRGFTLIEITMVLAAISILVSLAVPAYTFSIVRSNRVAAQAYLMDLANREEQYLLDSRSYTTDRDTLLAPPTTVTPYYTVAIAAPAGSTIALGYVITATPVATSMQKDDGVLTLQSDGQKTGKW